MRKEKEDRKNIEEILTDHAFCEQKATSTAISLSTPASIITLKQGWYHVIARTAGRYVGSHKMGWRRVGMSSMASMSACQSVLLVW